jgi:hypothetical protein
MVFGASAQTPQQVKADPGANNGPPAGAILDLNGQAIPTSYMLYTVNFQATIGQTAITFAFRNDPSFTSFTNASVNDVTIPSTPGPNLLLNGNFSGGVFTSGNNSSVPNNWTYANIYGATFGGVADSGCGIDGGYCWYDGAVQAYDAISQTIATNVGDTYQISFYVTAGGGTTFSDISTNSDNCLPGNACDTGGNGIDVAVYAQAGLPPPAQETLTVTGAGAGSGNVVETDNSYPDLISCTITDGSAGTTGCSANYPINTSVTLTATPASDGVSTFGGWGGACASYGTTSPCTVTMSMAQSVVAIFNVSTSSTQGGTGAPGQPTNLNYNNGYNPTSSTSSGQTLTVTETGSTPPESIVATQLVQNQSTSCQAILSAPINASFFGASCLEVANVAGPGSDGFPSWEVTCPGSSTSPSCGSSGNQYFFANFASSIYFNTAPISPSGENPGLWAVNNSLTLGGKPYGSGGTAPLIGFLAYDGTHTGHPCEIDQTDPYPALRNQVTGLSFLDGTPTAKPVTGGGSGTGSCWLITYGTPNEAPTVSFTSPANGGTYYYGQSTATDYACTTSYNGNPMYPTPSSGGYPAPTSPTGPYLTGTCSATDSPGGAVSQGGQFDTNTVGPHTFTATIVDSATNMATQSASYTVMQATTSTAVVPGTSNTVYGQPASFNTTVAVVLGAGTPTGTITWSSNTGCGTLALGTACVTSILTAGSDTVGATFNSNNPGIAGSGSGTSYSVGDASTSTTVTSSTGVNPSLYGNPVVFSARVSSAAGTLTGSVTWNITCSSTTSTPGNPLVATCTNSSLPPGMDTITATYQGDADHSPGLPASLVQTVDQAPKITSANAVTFTLGVPATPFTVTSTGYPTSTISYSGGLPAGVTFVPGLNGTGTLSGTPTVGGTFPISFTATNGISPAYVQPFTLTTGGPLLSVTPPNYALGIVDLYFDIDPLLITVKNIGTVTANITSMTLTRGPNTNTDDFTLIDNLPLFNLCTSTLAPGKTCYIAVIFYAGNVGTPSATVSVSSNSPGSPKLVTFSATVINPLVSFSPNSLSFGTIKHTTTSTLPVKLSNPGTSPLTINSIGITGTNASNFKQTNNCPISPSNTLANGSYCTIEVTFTPGAVGSFSGNLTVNDNAPLGTQIVPLSGKGN